MSTQLQMKLHIERKSVEKVTRTVVKPASIHWLVKDPYRLFAVYDKKHGCGCAISAKIETSEITFFPTQDSFGFYSSGEDWSLYGGCSGYSRINNAIPVERARLLFAALIRAIKEQMRAEFPAEAVDELDIICEIQEEVVQEKTVTEDEVDVYFELPDTPFPQKGQICGAVDNDANAALAVNEGLPQRRVSQMILKGYGWASDVSCTSAKLAKLDDAQITALYENLAKEIIKLPPPVAEEIKPAPAKPQIYDITTQTKFTLTPLVKASDKA